MNILKEKQEDSEEHRLKVLLVCELESWIEKDAKKEWKIEADYTIRLLNPIDSEKNVVMHGTHAFGDVSEGTTCFVKSKTITDEFWEDDSITFEVEIGVKSVNLAENCTKFGVKTPETDVVLVVDGVKFYVKKEVRNGRTDW